MVKNLEYKAQQEYEQAMEIDRIDNPKPTTLQEVLNTFDQTRAELLQALRQAIIDLITKEGEATSDDVYDLLNDYPNINKKVLGSVFLGLKTQGIIEKAGYKPSVIPSSHSRSIAIWIFSENTEERLKNTSGANALIISTEI